MDRVWWWQPKQSQGRRYFETIWRRWAMTLHKMITHFMADWTVLTQTCLSTQVTGTWLISACTKLVWLNRRARGLLATLDPHLSCRECLGLFLCRMSELCQLFFQLDKWLLWNYLQCLWPAFTWICIFRKSDGYISRYFSKYIEQKDSAQSFSLCRSDWFGPKICVSSYFSITAVIHAEHQIWLRLWLLREIDVRCHRSHSSFIFRCFVPFSSSAS